MDAFSEVFPGVAENAFLQSTALDFHLVKGKKDRSRITE